MTGEIKAVLFDLDDTLLKSGEIKWQHHKTVAKQFYGIELTDEVLNQHWGKPFDELIGYLYQNADTVENMKIANRSIEDQFKKEIQDDTHEVLAYLGANSLRTGIITSVSTEYAKQDLAIVNIDAEQFLFIHGADDSPFHKPDPRVFDPAMKILGEYGIDETQTMYVGDALIDHQAAHDRGLGFIGVATGAVTLQMFEAINALAVPKLHDTLTLILPDLKLQQI